MPTNLGTIGTKVSSEAARCVGGGMDPATLSPHPELRDNASALHGADVAKSMIGSMVYERQDPYTLARCRHRQTPGVLRHSWERPVLELRIAGM